MVFSFHSAYSKGDLTRQKPIVIKIDLISFNGKSHFFSPSEISFETSKLYKLILVNNSKSKHYFTSKGFSDAVYTRKIQVTKQNARIAEIKGNISEIEVFPGYSVEWWFVPIKTGEFTDLNCRVQDRLTGKSHNEMGMTGKIIIY